MKRYLLLLGLLGCRHIGTSDTPRVGVEKAKVPPVPAGEADSLSGCTNQVPRLPTVQMMADLTSSTGTGPLVVSVDNSGQPVDESLLSALAGQVQILDAKGIEVPSTKTIKNVTGGMYDSSGFRTTPVAKIEISPRKPFKDEWHTLKVRSVPAGLAWPRLSTVRELPDGSRVARFAPGSHPTPVAVRACEKEGGRSALIVDWSEPVSAPPDAGLAELQEKAGVPSNCVLDPSAKGKGASSSLAFMCSKQPAAGSVVSISLNRRIASTSGVLTQISGTPVADRLTTRVEVDQMKPWSHGCRITRPW